MVSLPSDYTRQAKREGTIYIYMYIASFFLSFFFLRIFFFTDLKTFVSESKKIFFSYQKVLLFSANHAVSRHL